MKKPPAKRSAPSRGEDDERSSMQVETQWFGPLPPPAALDQFGRIVEDGAERISLLGKKRRHIAISWKRAIYSRPRLMQSSRKILAFVLCWWRSVRSIQRR